MEINLKKLLRIIPINNLLLYEKNDPIRTDKLIEKIHMDKTFYNPIMAVKFSKNKNSKRLIIDGVNRYRALVKLGAKNILIQEFDYFDDTLVYLRSNEHYLLGINEDDFFRKLKKNNVSFLRIKQNKNKLIKSLDDGNEIALIQIGDQQIKLDLEKNFLDMIKVLNRFVDSYIGKTKVFRKSEYFAFP